MYPIQSYPNQAQYANPYLQPQVNAVKIDINNPQAYGGTNSQGQVNPTCPQVQPVVAPYYCYPNAPVYNIPTVQQYTTPNAFVPPYIPQQVVQNNPQQNQEQNKQNTTQVNTPATVQTVVPSPVVVPPVPVVPAPVVVQQPAPAPMTQTQTVNVNPSIPAAVVDKKENTTVAPVEAIKTAPVEENNITKELNEGLASDNVDKQTLAIQKIAEIAQSDPVKAKALLNEKTFGQLVNIINADTSKLQGPTGKPDPANLSPLEKAEINKQFAVYTLAILQKNFREEINKEMKKNNLPDIAINDLPFIKEGIVNNLKDNPNPTIREACLSALNHIGVGRPEDKEVLRVLYDISAKHDSNPAVKATAQDYLTKLPA